MSDQDTGAQAPEGTEAPETTEAPAAEAPSAPARKFVYNGMELADIDPSMKPEQVRDIWAGTYGELTNAKVKGPEKDADGRQVYTFVRNVGHLG